MSLPPGSGSPVVGCSASHPGGPGFDSPRPGPGFDFSRNRSPWLENHFRLVLRARNFEANPVVTIVLVNSFFFKVSLVGCLNNSFKQVNITTFLIVALISLFFELFFSFSPHFLSFLVLPKLGASFPATPVLLRIAHN